VRATFSEIISAFNAHDAERWASVMDPSFVNWPGDVRGADEERRFIAAYFGRQRGTQYQQLDEIGLVLLTPEVALYRTYGEVRNAVDTNGQVQPPSRILEAWLFRKRGDNWRVAAYFTRPSPR
jgi:uncharacterized protein (TIGR02246 family)